MDMRPSQPAERPDPGPKHEADGKWICSSCNPLLKPDECLFQLSFFQSGERLISKSYAVVRGSYECCFVSTGDHRKLQRRLVRFAREAAPGQDCQKPFIEIDASMLCVAGRIPNPQSAPPTKMSHAPCQKHNHQERCQ